MDDMELHYGTIIGALRDGEIIPFLGAGANLCDRPFGTKFEPGINLPSGGELAKHLASRFEYTHLTEPDLAWISQYISVAGRGMTALYKELRTLFVPAYPATLLHKLLAVLPGVWKEKGRGLPFKIIVTTNYDDVLERCFFAARQPFDVVSYVAGGDYLGKFRHWSYQFKPEPLPVLPPREEDQSEIDYQNECDKHASLTKDHLQRQELANQEFWKKWPPKIAPPDLIDTPNEYTGLELDERLVIFKIHGAIDRYGQQAAGGQKSLDSFVITEDDYIEYLARTDISGLVPMVLAAELRSKNFWFLGYSLRDWNLRVILRRLWGEQNRGYNSWAILLNPEDLEKKTWLKQNVEILNKSLHDYICDLTFKLSLGRHLRDLDRRLEELREDR
jgi:hypothetical protein